MFFWNAGFRSFWSGYWVVNHLTLINRQVWRVVDGCKWKISKENHGLILSLDAVQLILVFTQTGYLLSKRKKANIEEDWPPIWSGRTPPGFLMEGTDLKSYDVYLKRCWTINCKKKKNTVMVKKILYTIICQQLLNTNSSVANIDFQELPLHSVASLVLSSALICLYSSNNWLSSIFVVIHSSAHLSINSLFPFSYLLFR